jgi:von Willebrand factor type A domain
MKRRQLSPFSLSFLDVMCCGFGAVVLLVLILNNDTVRAREHTFAELRAEAVRMEQEVLLGQDDLVVARNSLKTTNEDLVATQGQAEQAIEKIRRLRLEIAALDQETLASRAHVNRLTTDLKSLDSEHQRLGAETPEEGADGDKVREFRGEGDRQYLTGLKMGGKHILILVDVSASMLDETIINVLRRRNMDAASKRGAPKWRRALATAEWLVSNLPAGASFQLYTFNTAAQAAAPGSGGTWLTAANREQLERAVAGLRQRLPADGTSLYNAFAVAGKLSPKPDNILLITDGLPTQGRDRPGGTTVTAAERLSLFGKAADVLPAGIPVNTLLLPMEGDAYAAAAFWRLAVDTGGSFITPARDWP